MNQKIVRATLALLFVSLLITAPRAQQPPTAAKQSPEDRVALYQALLDLTNPWTVMCIAAHPDDEDGTSLIVMRRKYGAHTISLFSTFGEGGQNAIGPELYEELGAIRARETMAAAEVQGSEPYFLGLKDFGYTKSADETFKIWGHEEALRRMVLQIRKLRPDVIITNHSVTNNDHGQHQATARLTVEAFDAADDPKRFPEQLKDGVTVWQVQRLFVRARGNAQAQAATAPAVTIDPNERDPIRDTVYAEEALRGLQKHATQGPWPKTFAEFAARFRAFTGQSAAPGQLPPTRYVLVREAKGAAPITKDSHNFLDGLRLPEGVAKQLAAPVIDGRPLTEFVDQRERLLDALIAANRTSIPSQGKATQGLRSHQMAQRQNLALALATGVMATLSSGGPDLIVRREHKPLSLLVANHGIRRVLVKDETFRDPEQNAIAYFSGGQSFSLAPKESRIVKLNSQALLSYLGSDIRQRPPVTPTILSDHRHVNTVDILVGGTPVRIPIIPHLALTPAVEITDVTPATVVVTPQSGDATASVTMRLVNHQQVEFRGRLTAYLFPTCSTPGCSEAILSKKEVTIPANEERSISLSVPVAPGSSKTPFETYLSVEIHSSGDHWESLGRSDKVVVGYANARVAPNLRVGYVRGFDYSLPNALTALGVQSKELSVDEVKTADLQKYSSIIVDNRVYESEPGLIEANQKLLDYAKNGGTLIVFYHKSFEWNPDERRKRPQLAPYKLILGDERITDENAPITFLEPQHPVLNFPNKMGQEDFAGWIQERGLYYPKEWDPQFHALLQSNDPGEAPLKGGLLVADYGRGRYIYTSMVWYRELRAGVPGAYRMLANMISYGAKK